MLALLAIYLIGYPFDCSSFY